MKKPVIQILITMLAYFIIDIYSGDFKLILIGGIFFGSMILYTLALDFLDKHLSDFRSFWYRSYNLDTAVLLGVVIISSILRFYGYHQTLIMALSLFIIIHAIIELISILFSKTEHKTKHILRMLILSGITFIVVY
ncbi:MAG: hypothetical protein LW807_05815 [Proteobacteria bacterium]|jgi:hypothetical protein|nr:hypothetical protein [Pseudomonadota bacterium]